jgi:hypothetical protein
MQSRKRMYATAAAIVVDVPIAIILCVLAMLYWDMRTVEMKAEECKRLAPTVVEYRKTHGAFPTDSDADLMDPNLRKLCNYYSSGSSFAMALTGRKYNLQTYVFSSENNVWRWD